MDYEFMRRFSWGTQLNVLHKANMTVDSVSFIFNVTLQILAQITNLIAHVGIVDGCGEGPQ